VLTHTYEHFFAKGLASLVNAVEKAATAALADWNVLDPSSLRFTLEEFDEGIRKVRVLVGEGSSVSGSSTPTLLRFLQPPPAEGSSTPPKINDELARSILDETWDLLESPVLEDALDSCLATTFGMMRDLHWGTVFEDERPSPSGMAGSKAHPTYGTRPLATVLTKLKKTASSFYDGGRALAAESEGMTKAGGKQGERETPGPAAAFPSSYFAALEQLPAVLELADVSFS
jgi:peroxin-3